jgi:pilus assembly protein CpaB
MNWKAWAPLAIAIVLGVIAAKLARDMTQKNQTVEQAGTKLTKVVIAKNTIQPGQILKEEDLATAPFASEQTPEGTFANTSDVVGRVVLSPLIKGQPVVHTLLAGPGTGAGLQALVPDGMRAITIDVSESSSVAGLLTPGCHVDVVASINDAANGTMVARTLAQNLKVQALGQRVSSAGKGDEDPNAVQAFKTVTLVVTPEEAETIELASVTGRPRLVLRSSTDNAISDSGGVTVQDLTNNGKGIVAPPKALPVAMEGTPKRAATQPVAVVAPATQPVVEETPTRTIQIIRGSQESNYSVPIKPQALPSGSSQGASLDPFSK